MPILTNISNPISLVNTANIFLELPSLPFYSRWSLSLQLDLFQSHSSHVNAILHMQMMLGEATQLSFMYACSIYFRWEYFYLKLLQLHLKTLLRSKWDSFACVHPALVSIIHTSLCNVFHLHGMHWSLNLWSLPDISVLCAFSLL